MSDLDLARRAVACPRYPPIAIDAGVTVEIAGRLCFREDITGRLWVDVSPPGAQGYDWLPDFDDAATVGCLEALVREAWCDPVLHIQWSWTWSGWYVNGAHHRLPGMIGRCATEAAALVAALDAAP